MVYACSQTIDEECGNVWNRHVGQGKGASDTHKCCAGYTLRSGRARCSGGSCRATGTRCPGGTLLVPGQGGVAVRARRRDHDLEGAATVVQPWITPPGPGIAANAIPATTNTDATAVPANSGRRPSEGDLDDLPLPLRSAERGNAKPVTGQDVAHLDPAMTR